MTESVGEKVTAAIPILTLGLGLTALFLDVNNWWVIFILGWAVATPLAGIIFDHETESTEATTTPERADDTQDALDTLRDRYARGELTEEQFERKVAGLLETETVEDARDRVARGERAGADGDRTDREPEREPGP